MPFLLSNWKLIVVGALVALVALFYGLWRHEVTAFADYRAVVVAAGKAAEIEAKRVETEHVKSLENAKNEWNNKLPQVRAGAVANYIAHHPEWVPRPDSGKVPDNASGKQGNDAAGQECVPPAGFIQDVAEDALKIQTWQQWATDNKLEVK